MKGFSDRTFNAKHSCNSSTDCPDRNTESTCSEPGYSNCNLSKTSFWSGFFASPFSIFGTYSESKNCEEKASSSRIGWTEAVKRALNVSSMRKFHDHVLGMNKTGHYSSRSDIWLLGVCYKISQEVSSGDSDYTDGLAAFAEDFSSRILMTYRKGFDAIGDSKYTSDVNWGCMLRSSQMLVAQALLFHRLGRSWRKSLHKPLDCGYIEILYLFGDSEASPFSIHNLLVAGKDYGLAAGSWVGPYAMCRTWETLVWCKREETELDHSLPMAVYVVSGDEDGERGGAPVVYIDDASRQCFEFSRGQVDWTPILLLVPLVLGLDKINPRYLSLLCSTFTFPQSLGILGGRPGASTYIVGVQDEESFYLDPHEAQPVVDVRRDNLEADTSSYHCNVKCHVPLHSLDPSLAIGFYCQDKDDFDDFCSRASNLADRSNGAPLFTVSHSRNAPKPTSGWIQDAEGCSQEDDWQIL